MLKLFDMDRNKAIEILEILEKKFPQAHCELNYKTPFELLVATVLSAQCTDVRVNKVASELFKIANTPMQFEQMPIEDLQKYIFSCGFYKNKSQAIKALSHDILVRFDGKVPDNLKDLQTLKGVGRKTANVVYAEAFKGAAIAVDTHVFRVSNRLGLADAKTPEATEDALKAILPEDKWSRAHHLLIFLGRYQCKSQKPDCINCELKDYCRYYKTNL